MIVQPSSLQTQPSVRLHIERLVLDGLPMERTSASALQAAVEAELARLFAERGVPASLLQGAVLPRVSGPALNLAATSKPAALGRQIAQAVYGGLEA